jgi:hypothetical protein
VALEEHDELAKVASAQSPEAAVLEALLVLIHEHHTEARVGEIAELAEGILLGRQQTIRFSAKAVGAILTDHLGLHSKRKGAGYELRLDSATCREIHRSANHWGVLSLLEPRPDCDYCGEVVRPAIPTIVDEASAPTTASATSTLVHPSEALALSDTSREEGL